MTPPLLPPLVWASSLALLVAPAVSRQGAPPVEEGAQRPQEAPASPAPKLPASGVLRLSLDEALQVALGNDLGLQIEELVTQSAGYVAAGSWGAFNPVLTAEASVFDAEFEASSPLSGTSVIEENTLGLNSGLLLPLTTGGNFSLLFDVSNSESNNTLSQGLDVATTGIFGLEFRQPLLRGFGSSYATSLQRDSELAYQRQLEQYRQTRQDLISAVTIAYWDLVSALDQLEVADETLALGERQLEQNQRRLEAGVGTQVEVLQAEANVAAREEQKLLRETEVEAAADMLKGLLYPGTDATTWEAGIEPTTPLPEPPESALELIPRWGGAWVTAQDLRSDLRQQRLRIEQADVQLVRASSESRPSLDLLLASRSRGFDGDPSSAVGRAAGWEFPQNTAALTFSYPLGNTSGRNALERARADLRAQRLVYDQLESQAVADVRTAIRQVTYSVKAVEAADKTHELAGDQLEAEEARYREGLSTNFQVLEYQQQLAQALYSKNLARANLAKSLVNLQKAQGILGEISR